MHGYAKRGLALVAAASGLVLGSAAMAAADATTAGGSALSGGLGSGNVAGVPLNVPVNFCGNQAVLAVVHTLDYKPMCKIGAGGGAHVATSTEKSGGVVAGNDVNGAVFAGGNVCGNQVAAAAVKNLTAGGKCTVDTSGAPESSAAASVDKSGGVLSGNAVSLAAAVPLNLCGNQVAVAAVKNVAAGSTCSIN
jgi:hypothetical protein